MLSSVVDPLATVGAADPAHIVLARLLMLRYGMSNGQVGLDDFPPIAIVSIDLGTVPSGRRSDT